MISGRNNRPCALRLNCGPTGINKPTHKLKNIMKNILLSKYYYTERTEAASFFRRGVVPWQIWKSCRGFMRKPLVLLVGTVLGCLASGDFALAKTPIPVDMIGEEALKHYKGHGVGINPTKDGAILNSALQDLEGEATAEGLWLTSRAEEDAGQQNRVMVRASGLGRDVLQALPTTGEIRTSADLVAWERSGVVEEYRVNGDGLRQDFVLAERPDGTGELTIELEVHGARVEEARYGAKLTLDGNNRELAYHRLQVSDATGRALPARMIVADAGRLFLRVDDVNATYPVRIDPTFSDADWVSWNTGIPGADDTVFAVITDSANNLYVGGSFMSIGSVKSSRVAKWSGSSWSALGKGVQGQVYALALVNGIVYAGGDFPGTSDDANAKFLAKWNGTAWSSVSKATDSFRGVDNVVRALVVNDTAGYIYVGGDFIKAGVDTANKQQTASGLARWDSNTEKWTPLADVIKNGEGVSGRVYALAYDKKTNILYAGGNFTHAGWTGSPATSTDVKNVARWVNEREWKTLNNPTIPALYGVNDIVRALAVDTNSQVYVGGNFTRVGSTLPANYVALWSETSGWLDLDSGVNGEVYALALTVANKLWVGGNFTAVGTAKIPANYIAQWDSSMTGNKWNPVISDNTNGTRDEVWALAVDKASAVYAGGIFRVVGSKMADRIAKMTGALTNAQWTNFGTGIDDYVYAMVMNTQGELYIAGRFITNGSIFVNCVAKWTGGQWESLGSGVALTGDYPEIYAMAFDKSENNLYVGGSFDHAGISPADSVARWNVASRGWFAVGAGLQGGKVSSLILDWQDTLIAGGGFTKSGAVPLCGVAKFVGQTWQAVASGPTDGSGTGEVHALAVDRKNAILYAGGYFNRDIGGTRDLDFIAQYSNSDPTWKPLGDGVDNTVTALIVDSHNDLNTLYAGGDFTRVGSSTGANRIARWDRVRWDRVGGLGGFNNSVYTLAIDSSRNLFAGGNFTTADGLTASHIATTDLSKDSNSSNLTWGPVGSGVESNIWVLFPSGNKTLHAGGEFFTAGNKTSPYIVALNIAPTPTPTPTPTPIAPAPTPIGGGGGGGGGGAPIPSGGGSPAVKKSKKGGGKSSAKISGSGSSKKSAASKSFGSKKSGGKKKKK